MPKQQNKRRINYSCKSSGKLPVTIYHQSHSNAASIHLLPSRICFIAKIWYEKIWSIILQTMESLLSAVCYLLSVSTEKKFCRISPIVIKELEKVCSELFVSFVEFTVLHNIKLKEFYKLPARSTWLSNNKLNWFCCHFIKIMGDDKIWWADNFIVPTALNFTGNCPANISWCLYKYWMLRAHSLLKLLVLIFVSLLDVYCSFFHPVFANWNFTN